MKDSFACDCGHPSQTMEHVINYCKIYVFNKSVNETHYVLNATLFIDNILMLSMTLTWLATWNSLIENLPNYVTNFILFY